jgi:anti-sigma factor RsiW
MFSCDTCRPLMLEYLYDLLEGDQRQDLETHLKDCPACQAELVRARNQRQLLAAAAKMEFANVSFTVPAETPAQPAVIPLPQPRRPRRWSRWIAVAAAVLLLLGAGVPAVWYGREYRQIETLVAQGKERIERTHKERRDAESQLARLPQEKQQRIESILKMQREARLRVQVKGPSALRAGAPTDFHIEATDLNGRPTAAKVSVEVKDRGQTIGKPIEAERLRDGTYHLTLPPDLPVRPTSQPTLVVVARRPNGSHVELREEMTLAAPVYVTHLEIDKPMYQLGETVHFRSLTLDRFSLKPAQEDLNLQFLLAKPGSGNPEIIAQGRSSLVKESPNGLQPLLGPDGKPLRGLGAGSFHIDESWPGGEYELIVKELNQRFPEQRRKFLVNRYEKPKLNKELDFSRKSYGPGDEVVARCKAKDLEGRPVKNCPVRLTVVIDNKQYGSQGEENREAIPFRTDDEGIVNVRFRLPKNIERGLGTVAVAFDGAMPDTIVRPIPIVLKKLDIEFCPEGGDLVAGLRNRVYFQVRSTLGKPADLKGQLLEDGKPLGVTVETLASEKTPEINQGMGRFEFTPRAGHKYELKVESPVGVTKLHELPPIKPDGVVLSVPAGVVGPDQDIPVTVRSTSKRSLMVGAYCRGRLLDSVELNKDDFHNSRSGEPSRTLGATRLAAPTGKETHAVLRPVGGAGGVCRVTVFEILPGDGSRRALKPVAERLIYRRPAERVKLALKPDRKTYVPRQSVKLGVEATTEKGKAAPAVVLLRVIDKSVVTLADDKTLRGMPTHFLLTTEVRRPEDLEYADFLLGPHPQAAEALDLLLGTQGWRRFAEQNPDNFRRQQKEEAERLLVTIGQSQPRTTDLTQQELERVETETAQKSEELKTRIASARQAEDEARDDRDYHAALVQLSNFDDFIDRSRRVGVPVLSALLLLAALACLILGLYRRFVRAVPYYAATIGCVAAVVLLVRVYWSAAPPTVNPERQMAQLNEKAAPSSAPKNNVELADDLKAPAKNEADGMEQRKARGAMFAPVPAEAAPGAPGAAPLMMGGAGANQGAKAPQAFDRGAGKGKGGEAFRKKADFADKAKDAKRALVEKRDVRQNRRMAGARAEQPRMPMADRARGKMPAMPAMPPPMDFARLRQMDGQFALRRQAALPPMPVRVFAHTRAEGPAEVRYDFAETLYWHPVLVLPDGKAEVSFDLCDSLGSFEVTAFAHTLDGRLGSATQTLTSRLPFTVQPRTPLEVTAGDMIDVPLALTNNTSEARSAHVSVAERDNLTLRDASAAIDVSVPADKSVRKLFRFQPAIQEGTATLAFTGKTGGFPADTIRTSFRIAPRGFPIAGSHSDVLEKSATTEVLLPKEWIKGTLKCQVNVYPSTLADLQKGLEALLREPCGCFEQTSTTNYPNILVLQYLKESDQAKPEVERRARELLERGYQKLTSFECLNTTKKAREGYEWFGGTAPAHEALTAYGLMEFRDMAKVREVDAAMMKRTRDYLLNQRDGNGGFRRNPRALDTFGRAPENVTNAYIVWALTESGKDEDVSKELNALHEKAKTSKDPYFVSLVANSLINRAKTADAAKLLKNVAEGQKSDGHLDAEQTSITGSGGRDLQIETTALAVLGWLKANPGEFNAPIQKAIKWIGQQRGGYGGFGSTQSTILALKALILYTKANKKTPEAGELRLFVGDKQIAALPFAAGATEPLTLSVHDAENLLKPGKNAVRVEITGKNVFPYTLSWSYHTEQPASAANCPVKLSAKLDRTEARESETVQLNVHVENASGKGQGMAVAILGLPGGLTVPEDMKQLKDYVRQPNDGRRPLVSAFEIRGRELVLYWRDLAPDQKIDVPIDLICRVPGEYSGPASRAYLYYNADLKHWVEPLKVRIAAARRE